MQHGGGRHEAWWCACCSIYDGVLVAAFVKVQVPGVGVGKVIWLP